MVTFDELNDSINNLTRKDLNAPNTGMTTRSGRLPNPNNPWFKVIRQFNEIRQLKQPSDFYQLSNSFKLLKSKFEEIGCTPREEKDICLYVSRWIAHFSKEYDGIPSLQKLAYNKLNPDDRENVKLAIKEGIFPDPDKKGGGKKRKSKRKKSKHLKRKRKNTRKLKKNKKI